MKNRVMNEFKSIDRMAKVFNIWRLVKLESIVIIYIPIKRILLSILYTHTHIIYIYFVNNKYML